jgi:hypothetical protein
MRSYILTDRERDIINKFLKEERPDTFRQLKSNSIKAIPYIERDLELIEKFLDRNRFIISLTENTLEGVKKVKEEINNATIKDTVRYIVGKYLILNGYIKMEG